MKTLRHIAPYILIAAYMPLLVALTFHTHSESHATVNECAECAHHIHHRAHMDEAVALAHNCVYCQLTTSSYYSSEPIALTFQSSVIAAVDNSLSDDYVSTLSLSTGSRAPPLQ